MSNMYAAAVTWNPFKGCEFSANCSAGRFCGALSMCEFNQRVLTGT